MASGATGRLFVVSGPSGAGKGTVVRGVVERLPDIVVSISATTRPRRDSETDGVDYRFVTPAEFDQLIAAGELLEWAEVYGHRYGTPRRPVEQSRRQGRDVLCELDVQGALQVKQAVPEAVLVFVEPPSLDELLARLKARGTEGPEAFARRAEAARRELAARDSYDHVIVNDSVDEAVAALVRILSR